MLISELGRASRRSIGFAVSSDDEVDARIDAKRRRVSYHSVTRTAHKVAATIDPRPYPTHRGLMDEEIRDIDLARDPERVKALQQRADDLQAHLLTGLWNLLPEDTRSRWNGDITLDGTVIPVFGRFHSYSRAQQGARSPEVNANLHAKKKDNREAYDIPNPAAVAGQTTTKWTHGYEAHLAVMTATPGGRAFPRLVLGLSLDRPGLQPGLNAATAVRGIVRAGLPTGTVTTDLGYSNQKVENYALPVRRLGYSLMHMFNANNRTKTGERYELGVKGSKNGVMLVEGALYGPCLPAQAGRDRDHAERAAGARHRPERLFRPDRTPLLEPQDRRHGAALVP